MTPGGSDSLSGRVAIVTGASEGVGAAVARRFASCGAIVVAASRNEENGLRLVREIEASGGVARYVSTDMSVLADVVRLVEVADGEFGRIDVVCNNAATDLVRSIEETTEEEFTRVMAVNVRGVFFLCKHALPRMRGRGGAIVNVASVAALIGLPQSAAYSASKGAVVSLTRQLAREYAGDGIRVNAVCLGSFDTPNLQRFVQGQDDPDGVLERIRSLNPLKRVGAPEEAAEAIAFLASERAAFVTGATLVVDGGWVIQ